MRGTAPTADDLLAPLGGTGWRVWRWSALRGAGMPADDVAQLCDDELAAAADQLDDRDPASWERYAAEFAAATGRLGAAMRAVASDELFREAVSWQNPALTRDCLDKVVRGERRNARGRYHELTIATYLQRYCVKNDTVGFFGPVGWARLGTADAGVDAVPHRDMLMRRTTYFEHWAIAALADALAERADVFPWLRPCCEPSVAVEDATAYVPMRPPVRLSRSELKLLHRCDGRSCVRDLAGDPPDPGTVARLLRLRQNGVLRLGLRGAVTTWPERELGERLAMIGDPEVRGRALGALGDLVAARDDLAAAAGDAAAVADRTHALSTTFARLTGAPTTRSAGATYAGRTLVYEDAVRGVDVRVGQPLLDRLAPPLGLLLDSAAWLATTLAERFCTVARAQVERASAVSGRAVLPLSHLLMACSLGTGSGSAGPAAEIQAGAVAELQDRWRRVLARPDGRTHGDLRFTAGELADRVAREFPGARPAWFDAQWHSPDIMITARDPAALAAGDVEFVLGELHCATNTMRTRLFVENHPDRRDMRRLLDALDSHDRYVLVPRTDWPTTTARMLSATETMLPGYRYIHLGEDAVAAPDGAAALSVMALDVVADGAGLRVCDRRTGEVHAFLEVVGDLLAGIACDAFQPFAVAGRRPRITIDRLVVARASVTVPATDVDWACRRDEARRFADARRWRTAVGLPERVFVRVPVERKPIALDFRSLPLVNVAAKAIRRAAEVPGSTATLTEMLPDTDELWLTDSDGRRYTAELRMVAMRPPTPA